MKKNIFLTFLFFVSVVSHSQTSPTFERDKFGRPAWATKHQDIFSDEFNLYSVGQNSNNMEKAEQKAYENLRKYFGTAVESNVESYQSYMEKEEGNRLSIESVDKISVETKVFAQAAELIGVRSERYRDPSNFRCYFIVYMQKSLAIKVYTQKIDANLSEIKKINDAASSGRNLDDTFRNYRKAAGIVNENKVYANILALFGGPDRMKAVTSGLDYNSEAQRLAESTKFEPISLHKIKVGETLYKEIKISSSKFASVGNADCKVSIVKGKSNVVFMQTFPVGRNNKLIVEIPTTHIAQGLYRVQLELLLYDIERSGQHNPRTSFTLELTGITGEMASLAWKHKWLYAGVRAGFSVHDYVLNTLADISADTNVSFEAALAGEVNIIPLSFMDASLALQTELIFSMDKIFVAASNGDVNIVCNVFQIPLLAKFAFRPGNFYFAGFTGPYIAIPLGSMEITKNDNQNSADFSTTFGLTGGADAGIKIGPGVLFLDIRYSGDFRFFRAADAAQFRRNMFSLSAGYSYGFFDKRR